MEKIVVATIICMWENSAFNCLRTYVPISIYILYGSERSISFQIFKTVFLQRCT